MIILSFCPDVVWRMKRCDRLYSFRKECPSVSTFFIFQRRTKKIERFHLPVTKDFLNIQFYWKIAGARYRTRIRYLLRSRMDHFHELSRAKWVTSFQLYNLFTWIPNGYVQVVHLKTYVCIVQYERICFYVLIWMRALQCIGIKKAHW